MEVTKDCPGCGDQQLWDSFHNSQTCRIRICSEKKKSSILKFCAKFEDKTARRLEEIKCYFCKKKKRNRYKRTIIGCFGTKMKAITENEDHLKFLSAT